MKTFNLQLIDKDGLTLETKGVKPEDVKRVKQTMRERALANDFKEPLYFHQYQKGK